MLVQAGKEGTIFRAQSPPVGTLGGYTGNGLSDSTLQALKQMLCYNAALECGVTGSGPGGPPHQAAEGRPATLFCRHESSSDAVPILSQWKRLHQYRHSCRILHNAECPNGLHIWLARTHARSLGHQCHVVAGDCLGGGYPQSWKQGSRCPLGL
jgi:hypothetical protein